LYYTYRRAGQGYGGSPPAGAAEPPLRVVVGTPQNSRLITNVRVAASLRDRSYGHAVGELFTGEVPFAQYYLFGLPVSTVGASAISIEGGARVTNKSTVGVAFAGLTGAPTGVRWSWGAPPAANAPYSPFNSASPTIAVPVPPAASPNCAPLTLYTQLRSAEAEQQAPNSATILLDRAVQAEYFVSGVPPALDPRYTRTLSASVTIYSAADCAGLAAAAVAGPVPGGTLSLPVAGRPLFQQTIPLTGDPATPGPKALAFVSSDLAGNSTPAPITRTVIYDPVAPTLRGAAPESAGTLVPNPKGTSQLTLALNSFDATDVGGVVAGIELVATAPARGGAATTSAPLRLPFSRMDQVTRNDDGTLNLRATFSLLELFAPAQLAPGTYSFEVRALDGAGNASEERLALAESLPTLTFPAWAPLLRR
ncbi:MAG TPA: hypothetical protein PKD53_24455, partial [Chloroflexaceae bacterium]|nr:hypothetical protein [Chloroflexaceae bacterium]